MSQSVSEAEGSFSFPSHRLCSAECCIFIKHLLYWLKHFITSMIRAFASLFKFPTSLTSSNVCRCCCDVMSDLFSVLACRTLSSRYCYHRPACCALHINAMKCSFGISCYTVNCRIRTDKRIMSFDWNVLTNLFEAVSSKAVLQRVSIGLSSSPLVVIQRVCIGAKPANLTGDFC